MPHEQSALSRALNKARELRITQGFGLFLLTKVPNLHEYSLVNCASPGDFKRWLQKETYKFVCLIDEIDILLIDSTLPWHDLHSLFTECETLAATDRTCLELADFLDILKERSNAPTPPVPN